MDIKHYNIQRNKTKTFIDLVSFQNISLMECQSTHRQVDGDSEIEVISFYPGVACDDAGCGRAASECKIDDRTYEVGEKAVLGCQECTCERSGQFVCR